MVEEYQLWRVLEEERNNSGWRGGQQRKSTERDFSEVTCHYCEGKGQIQFQCATLREDLKSLKQLKGKVHIVEFSDDGDLYHIESADNDSIENHSKWVLDFATNVRVCKDQAETTIHSKVNGITLHRKFKVGH